MAIIWQKMKKNPSSTCLNPIFWLIQWVPKIGFRVHPFHNYLQRTLRSVCIIPYTCYTHTYIIDLQSHKKSPKIDTAKLFTLYLAPIRLQVLSQNHRQIRIFELVKLFYSTYNILKFFRFIKTVRRDIAAGQKIKKSQGK